jgi:hypothetical protein
LLLRFVKRPATLNERARGIRRIFDIGSSYEIIEISLQEIFVLNRRGFAVIPEGISRNPNTFRAEYFRKMSKVYFVRGSITPASSAINDGSGA